ncbi:hypothetical protein [Martelella endophytica]|uniref:Uncharacterized protein n=1 Tax=Martelella endophytica TaxID=1486262 RepID=A0A0D5LN02_MAREN|nr:hypothetical protein [Martelella endophytica]AJY44688.1 hypothetical protein TM49_01715 [Martelella endophytica]
MDAIVALVSTLSAFAQSAAFIIGSIVFGALYIVAVIAVTAVVFRLFSRRTQKARRLPTTKHAVHPDGLEKD